VCIAVKGWLLYLFVCNQTCLDIPPQHYSTWAKCDEAALAQVETVRAKYSKYRHITMACVRNTFEEA